ncbi:MAG: hypothetical protein OXE17_09145 [Chloroflexi bacterium]|nr:hypothetical protein [Chloroflexota bacterium]
MVIKQRSPNYPGIDLPNAIEHVRGLYSKVKGGDFTASDAAQSWNLSAASGGVRRRMGALRQYGLIEQRKGDTAKLTPRSLTVVLRNPESNEFKNAVKEAILSPDLFRDLYESGKYQSADDALKQLLVMEKRFSDEGATRFIEVMRASFDFVDLDDSESLHVYNEGVNESVRDDITNMPVANSDKVLFSVTGGSASMRMELPLPLTDDTWNSLIAMVKALKPMLVESPQPAVTLHPTQLDLELDGSDENYEDEEEEIN